MFPINVTNLGAKPQKTAVTAVKECKSNVNPIFYTFLIKSKDLILTR